jgi:hypothetical protein
VVISENLVVEDAESCVSGGSAVRSGIHTLTTWERHC